MSTEMIQATLMIPCPMADETKRQKTLEEHRVAVWAKGCIILSESRLHNPVFDKKGEKSTTKMVIRPAQTDDELEFILSKLEAKLHEWRTAK